MAKKHWLIILGLFLAILPQLGLPSEWKSYILLVLGIIIAIISYTLPSSTKPMSKKESLPYTEFKKNENETAERVSDINSPPSQNNK